ncbi:MAG: glycoside hydrolase family 97 protein [Bacteroidetes bacterium]|nr:glycoside hydrolase family 97 protein [Bacteroidota bacterium]
MKKILTLIICIPIVYQALGKEYSLFSPDMKKEVTLNIDTNIGIIVKHDNEQLFAIDNISLEIADKLFASERGKIKKSKTTSVDEKIYPEIKEKLKVINDKYNELEIVFKGNYSLQIRAYNEGVSYRIITSFADSVIVDSENFDIEFAERDSIYFQPSKTFNSCYETPYEHLAINDVGPEGYCCLPALVKKQNGINVLITESDLGDYPGLWLKGRANSSLTSAHAGYPVSFKYEGNAYRQGQVKKHASYIAKTSGNRTYPWRIFAIAENDADLISNTLVYQLAKPIQIENASWIKPGVVIFDWWGRRNIYGVDFKSGVNTATAKYFIDFTAEFGFEYFLFDDGWSEQGDLLAINPDLDMDEVMAYANKKGVKVMLWAIWNTFKRQEKEAWELFDKWGISGIKFDFMDRDDQKMVQFYHEMAKEAAKRNMVLNFHGAYKPAGLRRMYPNVLTREALIEFEYNGWSKHDSPEHHNMLPYLRMVAGPMDYIPYTTHNSTKKNFRSRGDMPMGQGTRAHSMALFVILESPMQMFPDSPADYYKERECTEFISKIPTEWDELKVISAKIGEYTVLARKNGDDWYIGAITDWNSKEFEISFNFLDEGDYKLEFIEDGINADTRAIDYKRRIMTVTNKDNHKIKLAPGGGWIARLSK